MYGVQSGLLKILSLSTTTQSILKQGRLSTSQGPCAYWCNPHTRGGCHSTSKNAPGARTVVEAIKIVFAKVGEGNELDESSSLTALDYGVAATVSLVHLFQISYHTGSPPPPTQLYMPLLCMPTPGQALPRAPLPPEHANMPPPPTHPFMLPFPK